MGLVGAKRTLHFTRHLPALGWDPAVVALPVTMNRDPTLEPLVPDVPMWRGFRGGPIAWLQDRGAKKEAPTHGYQKRGQAEVPHGLRGLLAPLDRYAPHLPWAFAGSLKMLRQHRCRLIYATSGPTSSFLLGVMLQRATGLPLVVDFRDPWSLERNYRARWSAAGAWLVETLERYGFQRASKVILNTESALRAHQEAYASTIPPERFTFIRNQYDPALYETPPASPREKNTAFLMVYYGHLRPSKNAKNFLRAYRRFIDKHALQPQEARFITLGERTAEDDAEAAALGLGDYLEGHDWLSFTRSRSLLGRADLLIDLMGPQHQLQISGKIYDYFAAERPILSVSPNRELDAIFAETGAGERVDDDEDAIVAALSRALEARRRRQEFTPNRAALRAFTAQAATEKLARIFDEVVR